MRVTHAAALLTATALVVGGCTNQVVGTAVPDPQQPPVALTGDGYGVVAGFDTAPVQLEIFTEPQCSHCADLQDDFGAKMAAYIGMGQLEVTYRPLTFLDSDSDYSARVSNAMFIAADSSASGVEYQNFVRALWANQDPSGFGPSDDELAEMAREAGIPTAAANSIADGEVVVDTFEMDDSNFGALWTIDPLNVGTPTVYDLTNDEIIDIYDNDWLDQLIQSA